MAIFAEGQDHLPHLQNAVLWNVWITQSAKTGIVIYETWLKLYVRYIGSNTRRGARS
jgi:hypothetical protein